MKVKLLYVSLYLFLSAISVTTHAGEAHYIEFSKKLQAFHEVSQKAQADLLTSQYIIAEALEGYPSLEELEESAASMAMNVTAFEASYKKLLQYVESNKGHLSGVVDVVTAVETEVSQEMVDKIIILAEAYSTFVKGFSHESFSVYANEVWANSGISTKTGDFIWITAQGQWSVSSSYGSVGSKGYVNNTGAYRINDQASLGELLFRVRGSAQQNGYTVDVNGRGMADANGRLEFTINDTDTRNNSGQLELTILHLEREALSHLISAIENLKKQPE